MIKCKKCGDLISDEFEICYECKDSTEIKNKFKKYLQMKLNQILKKVGIKFKKIYY
jgi:RNA polymerase subunit RPABC4/transcription elongation factor Spt4